MCDIVRNTCLHGAEGARFELARGLPPYSISSAALSTGLSHPSLIAHRYQPVPLRGLGLPSVRPHKRFWGSCWVSF